MKILALTSFSNGDSLNLLCKYNVDIKTFLNDAFKIAIELISQWNYKIDIFTTSVSAGTNLIIEDIMN